VAQLCPIYPGHNSTSVSITVTNTRLVWARAASGERTAIEAALTLSQYGARLPPSIQVAVARRSAREQRPGHAASGLHEARSAVSARARKSEQQLGNTRAPKYGLKDNRGVCEGQVLERAEEKKLPEACNGFAPKKPIGVGAEIVPACGRQRQRPLFRGGRLSLPAWSP
jgi:hypothetical protein